MKKLLVGAVTAAVLAVAAPAHAHPSYHYLGGGCGYTTVSDGDNGSSTTWQGEASIVAVASTAAGVPAPIATISVECHLYRNGVHQGVIVSGSGTGAVVSVTPFTFQADAIDVINVCGVINVGGDEHVDCSDGADPPPSLPWFVEAAIDAAFAAVNDVFYALDPVVCGVIQAGAPGIPGVVDITAEGDVYIAGELFWDCPPYAGR